MSQLGLLGVEYTMVDEIIDTGHYQDQFFFDRSGKTTPLLSMAVHQLLPGRYCSSMPIVDSDVITCVLAGTMNVRAFDESMTINKGGVLRISPDLNDLIEFGNPSSSECLKLFRVVVKSEEEALESSYEQRDFNDGVRQGRLCLRASPTGQDGSICIGNDVSMFMSSLGRGDGVRHELRAGRMAWVHVFAGRARVNGSWLRVFEPATFAGEASIEILAESDGTEIILVDSALLTGRPARSNGC